MATESTIRLTFAYDQTDFTRSYAMNVDSSIAADYATIKSKINAINDSLAAGTDGGLSTFFLADDYDGVGGTMKKISAAQVEITTENIIF